MTTSIRGRRSHEQERRYRNAYDRWRRAGKVGPKPLSQRDAESLDPAPLVALIEQRHMEIWSRVYWDGIEHGSRVPAGKGLTYFRNAVDAKARWVVACYLAAATDVTPETVHQLIQRWRKGYRVSVYVADRVCGVLGKHISELYPLVWEDAFISEEASA